jgi:hypothetical protein
VDCFGFQGRTQKLELITNFILPYHTDNFNPTTFAYFYLKKDSTVCMLAVLTTKVTGET